MALHARQLRTLVVRPVLTDIGLWSKAAEDLVMGTAAQESLLRYLHQLGSGPAIGLWQMEPATYHDHWVHFIGRDDLLRGRLLAACQIAEGQIPPAHTMAWNLRYAAAMCRIHYLRKPGAIPETVAGQAAYWKRWYNTHLGAGTVEEYEKHYRGLIA